MRQSLLALALALLPIGAIVWLLLWLCHLAQPQPARWAPGPGFHPDGSADPDHPRWAGQRKPE